MRGDSSDEHCSLNYSLLGGQISSGWFEACGLSIGERHQ